MCPVVTVSLTPDSHVVVDGLPCVSGLAVLDVRLGLGVGQRVVTEGSAVLPGGLLSAVSTARSSVWLSGLCASDDKLPCPYDGACAAELGSCGMGSALDSGRLEELLSGDCSPDPAGVYSGGLALDGSAGSAEEGGDGGAGSVIDAGTGSSKLVAAGGEEGEGNGDG